MSGMEPTNKYFRLEFSTANSGTVNIIVGPDQGVAWGWDGNGPFGFDGTNPTEGADFLGDLGTYIANYVSSSPNNYWGATTYVAAWSPWHEVKINP